MIFYVILLIFIIVSNIVPIKEYMAMQDIEVQHEQNAMEIKDLKNKSAKHRKAVEEAVARSQSNTTAIGDAAKEIGNFLCTMNSGEGGDEELKKKFC
tara:strand:- start:244 stop:534 length:291 start_codon:yes stop_codon:yes gene_type:complete